MSNKINKNDNNYALISPTNPTSRKEDFGVIVSQFSKLSFFPEGLKTKWVGVSPVFCISNTKTAGSW